MASLITSIFKVTNIAGGLQPLFFGANTKTKIGDLILDACLTEVITLSSTITEHPIESKEAITDHIFKNPLKIKIEGYITDAPIRLFGILEMPLNKNSVNKLVNNVKSFLPFSKDTKPSIQAYQLLTSMFEQRQLLDIVTKLNVFKDMAIESITFNNNVDTGGRLDFTAELTQVKFASVTKSFYSRHKSVDIKESTAVTNKAGVSEESKSAAAASWDKVKGFFEDIAEKERNMTREQRKERDDFFFPHMKN